MLAFDIEIHGNDNGEIFYSVTFQNGTRHEPEKIDSVDIDFIERLTDALKELSATAEN